MLPHRSLSPSVDGGSSDQLQFPTELSLTKLSLMDGKSYDMLDDSPPLQPSDDIPTSVPDQVKSPGGPQSQPSSLQPPLPPPAAHGLLTDYSSLFDQESRLELQLDLLSVADANLSTSISPANANNAKDRRDKHDDKISSKKENQAKSTTLTLKEQGKTIDRLYKENFNLKMKINYLEKLTSDRVGEVLEENEDLKKHIETLTQELKKYKKMILELNSTVNLLHRANQPCTKQHGMSEEERAEYNAALANSAQYREENERLQQMVADMQTENAKLRASVRSSRNSSPLVGALRLSRSNSRSSGSRYVDDNNNDEENDYWVNHQKLSLNKDAASEAEMYKKEWLQAKQVIEKQNQTIQRLREENESKLNSRSSLSHASTSDNSSLVKSLLADRDALVSKAERYQKANYELQEDIGRLRERNTEVVSQLLAKNKELDKVHNNMDELVRSLHDAKQQLRNKIAQCEQLRRELAAYQSRRDQEAAESDDVAELLETIEDLRAENANHLTVIDSLRRELKEMKYTHKDQVRRLEAEIEQREQDFAALESRVIKIMARAEKLEAQDQEKDALVEELEQRLENQMRLSVRNHYNQEIERLERELQEKEEQLAKYERRIREENDMVAFEEHLAQLELTIEEKDAAIKERERELEMIIEEAKEAKARYEEDLKGLESRLQEFEQDMRERDVRIATLEDHLEAQTDAMQREKELYQEEIKELEEKLSASTELLQRKDALLASLELQLKESIAGARDAAEAYEQDLADIKEQLGNRMIEAEEEWQAKMTDLQERLRETEEQLKKDRKLANEKLNEALNAKRILQQRLESASLKNGLLNDLLDQYQRSHEQKHNSRIPQANQILTKLNQELQRELEDKDRALQRESARAQKLDELYSEALEKKKQLEELLLRRNSMITKLFERLENTKERDSAMANALLRQAAEDMQVGSRRRANSIMSSR